MMNALTLDLKYEGTEIRVVGTADNPQWVAADVCAVLGISQPANVLRKFKSTEKGMYLVHTPHGDQKMLTITEAGLYRLIFRSDKPSAEKFRTWVTHEVLPCIRKHGCYPAPEHATDQHAIVRLDAQSLTVALTESIGKYMGGLATGLNEVRGEVSGLKGEVASLRSEVSRIVIRKDLTERTKAKHNSTVWRCYRGFCPCCNQVQVVDVDGPTAHMNYDHWILRSKNGADETWPVCADCNRKLESQDYRHSRRAKFEAYQMDRKELEETISPTFQFMRGN